MVAQKPVAPEPWSENQRLHKLCEERFASRDHMAWHMPTLWSLARECQFCVEFGVRRANSTVALLAGCPGVVLSWDVDNHVPTFYDRIRQAAGKRWALTIGDSVQADFAACDLLLHDSLHSYDHVRAELEAHAHRVARYLVFHDSVSCATEGIHPITKVKDKAVRGMMPAIEELMAHGEWKVLMHDRESAGLLVLERKRPLVLHREPHALRPIHRLERKR